MSGKKAFRLAMAIAALICFSGIVYGQEISNTTEPSAQVENDSVIKGPKIGGLLQGFGLVEVINDTNRTPERVYLFLKNARLNVSGSYNGVNYYGQWAFGGEEVPNGANSVISLLDFYVDIPLLSSVGLRVGQFKTPYGYEQLSFGPNSVFAENSINTLAANVGRDVGLAGRLNLGDIKGALGVFTGGGIDQPIRYIPQIMGVPMIVGRFGYDNFNKDAFTANANAKSVKGTQMAAYFNFLYEKDSEIGHSSVMSTKQNEKSLFYRTSWNPYLRAVPKAPNVNGNTSQFPFSDFMQIGGNCAFGLELGDLKLKAVGELNYGSFTNQLGGMTMTSGMAQVGAYYNPFEIAVRYAIILPDGKQGVYNSRNVVSTNNGMIVTIPGDTIQPIVDTTPIQEINPSLTIYFDKQNIRLTMDMQIYVDAPIIYENTVGPYNLMLQPDQTSLIIKGGNQGYATSLLGQPVPRQNEWTGRMIMQFIF